jgi:hypothetical protein
MDEAFKSLCAKHGVDSASSDSRRQLELAIDRKCFPDRCRLFGVDPHAPDAVEQYAESIRRYHAGCVAEFHEWRRTIPESVELLEVLGVEVHRL